jgi:FKBP-type peptidyl-prolyl cis-trans isomerase FklB
MKQSIFAFAVAGLLYAGYSLSGPGESTTAAGEPSEGVETEAEPAPATEGAEPRVVLAPAPAAVPIESDTDKVNYSLGYELGKDLQREELELLPEVLIKGAQDALSGAKPLVRTTQRRKALAEIKKKRAEANLQESQAFLAANAGKEGVATLPSGLQYKEIRAGEGKAPGPGDSVTVNYRGTLVDGSEFDSSYERGKPSTFQVKRVIKGWAEALQLMQEGAKWEIFIPPELGYGRQGRAKRIPPNSALVFEVELISVNPGAAPAAR